jgi:NMD protein affecting ribosome stability and mRNA decay
MRYIDAFGRNYTWTKENILDSVGPGWRKLLEELLSDLEKLGWDGYLFQVKEKFGGLRFYAGGDDYIYDRISKAEEDSYHICENCGDEGKARNELSWIKTLCDKCFKERAIELNMWDRLNDCFKRNAK